MSGVLGSPTRKEVMNHSSTWALYFVNSTEFYKDTQEWGVI